MTESCKPKRAKFKPLPSYERVRELFHYEPATGVLTWRISTNNRVKPGDVVGCPNSNGYWVGHIDGSVYVLHRIIWLWMTGEDPGEREVDHENTTGADNKWGNLRLATSSQNNANWSLSEKNVSGCKGVTWCKQNKKWLAKITKDRKQEYLGLFVRVEDAAAAYMTRARELFGEFARAA
mgnify:CR=1 FL=1